MPNLKTFIVEDNPLIVGGLISMLEELVDIEVLGAVDEESAAVDWLRQHADQPELLIIDIMLRTGTGLGVLEKIHPLAIRAARVVLTNHATPMIRARCSELGADRVFDKSIELDALLEYCSGLRQSNELHAPEK